MYRSTEGEYMFTEVCKHTYIKLSSVVHSLYVCMVNVNLSIILWKNNINLLWQIIWNFTKLYSDIGSALCNKYTVNYTKLLINTYSDIIQVLCIASIAFKFELGYAHFLHMGKHKKYIPKKCIS